MANTAAQQSRQYDSIWFIEFATGFLICIPMVFPEYLKQIFSITGLNKVIACLGFLLFAACCFFNLSDELKKLRSYSPFILPCAAFFLYYSLLTVIKHGDIYHLASAVLICVSCCLVFYTALTRKRSGMAEGILLYYELLLLATLVTQIIFPEGLYELGKSRVRGLLGHVNAYLRILLPGLQLSLLRSFRKCGKMDFRAWAYLIIMTVLPVLTGSVTSTVVICAVLLLLAVISLPKKQLIPEKWISCSIFYLLSALLFLTVLLTRKLGLFQWFTETVMHRDATLNGRTKLWMSALKLIREKPLFGYGYQGHEFLENIFKLGSFTAVSGHNLYVDLLLENGITGLLLFLGIILNSCLRIDKSRSAVARTLSVTMLAIFISILFETFNDTNFRYFFIPLTVTYIASSPYCGEGAVTEKKKTPGISRRFGR